MLLYYNISRKTSRSSDYDLLANLLFDKLCYKTI